MSTNGASQDVGTTATSVGDFTTLLLDINPTYTTHWLPECLDTVHVTVSGLGSPTTGRLAFRYFVENGGPNGANSDYIGIDTCELRLQRGDPDSHSTTDSNQYIWHCLLLLESSSWPSAKCDAYPNWDNRKLNSVRRGSVTTSFHLLPLAAPIP